MGHGTPDWWGSEPGETTFQVQDVGELAVRLGSIDSFDRRGNVVSLDDFENGLTNRWANTFPGTSAISISAKYARSGAYSAELKTGAVAGDKAGIYRYFPSPVLGKVGIEYSFSLGDHTLWIEFWMEYFDGTNFHRFAVRYLPADNKWQYRNSAGGYTDLLTGINYPVNPLIFQTVKLVVDLEADKYYYIKANDKEESMAAIAGQVGASATVSSIYSHAEILTDDANIATSYIDDFILTQNEP